MRWQTVNDGDTVRVTVELTRLDLVRMRRSELDALRRAGEIIERETSAHVDVSITTDQRAEN